MWGPGAARERTVSTRTHSSSVPSSHCLGEAALLGVFGGKVGLNPRESNSGGATLSDQLSPSGEEVAVGSEHPRATAKIEVACQSLPVPP